MNWPRWMGQRSEYIISIASTQEYIINRVYDCRADNQPEFMQNLGFVPDAGIPEPFPYSDHAEPFLLAQAQQIPSCPETFTGRRESQQTTGSSTSKR